MHRLKNARQPPRHLHCSAKDDCGAKAERVSHLQQRVQEPGQGQVHEHHVKRPLYVALLLQALRVLQVQALAAAGWRGARAFPPRRVGAPRHRSVWPVATCAHDFLPVSTTIRAAACEGAPPLSPAELCPLIGQRAAYALPGCQAASLTLVRFKSVAIASGSAQVVQLP